MISLKNPEPSTPIRILLVGREGNGKSSCVKTITNSRPKDSNTATDCCKVNITHSDGGITDICSAETETFAGSGSPEYVTAADSIDVNTSTSSRRPKYEIIAEKCSGVGDKGEDLREDIGTVINDVSNKIKDSERLGPIAAIVFVMKYGVRFTKQEKDSVEVVKSMFGEDVFSRYGIILMTYGDLFTSDDEEDRTFKGWCEDQTGDIQKLFEEVNYRIVLFDNKTEDTSILEEQYNSLYKTVSDMKVKYGAEKFDQAESGREKLRKRENPDKISALSNFSNSPINTYTRLEKLTHHKEKFFILVSWLIFWGIFIICLLYLLGKIAFYQAIMIIIMCLALGIVLKITFKHYRYRPTSYEALNS